MSCNVKVSGIPTHVKLGKLIPLFSNILSMRSSDFLLRILPSNGPVKDVLLSLPTYTEAHLAQEKLDNFVYKHNNITYVFLATMEGGFRQNNKKTKPRSKFQNQNFRQSRQYQYDNRNEERYRQDRSRSPHYENASSQLDMQIEILRKQRMILEEERKLLEEQRKLEQLKMKSYNNEIYNQDVEMSGPSSIPPKKKFESKQLTFHQASGVLMKKMNVFIYKHSSSEERKALITHLRSLLKQRLAAVVAADGQGVYQTHKVIMLYRSYYPPSEDEELVKEALQDFKEGRWTDDTKTVKASAEGANAKSMPDETKSADGHTLPEVKAAKDTTFSDPSNVHENVKDLDNEKVVKKFEEKRLYFHKASSVLIRKMNIHMDKHSPPETRKLLVEYLRSTLKLRLAAAVAGQPIYQTHKIIKLYRSQHPATEDEDLIKQLLKDIDEGRVSNDILIKTKETREENTPGENKNAEINSEISQEDNFVEEKVIDESGQLDNTKCADMFGNTDIIEIQDNVEECLEYQCNKTENADCIGQSGETEKGLHLKNETKTNSPNNLVSVNDSSDNLISINDSSDNLVSVNEQFG